MFDIDDFSGLNGIVTDGSPFGEPTMIDTDGDGVPDTIFEAIDTDGDGLVDTFASTYGVDTDGDGFIDTIMTELDFNLDGIPDAFQSASDTDGDGVLDMYSEAFSVDADGDGFVDTLNFAVDNNMDGELDVAGFIDSGNNISFFDEISNMQNEVTYIPNDVAYPDVPNFDPDNFDPDSVIGNPAEAMRSFHVQSGSSSCAVVAQEFVLEQLTGGEFSESNLCDMAESLSWFDPDGGTLPSNVGNVLAEHGLSIQRNTGSSIQDIEVALENGGGVIVGVDCDELYDGDNDFFAPGDGANHAVQVIGIDKTDPDNPMVILNDSGIYDGCGAMVSLENFMAAWEDSDYLMVQAYTKI